jgi:Cd2+/Zn2+-exporting ATPase
MIMKKHELKLRVEGIDCPGCATDAEAVLLQLDGILGVNVNYAEETITIDFDPGLISDKQIVSAICRIGFSAVGVQHA